MSEAEKRVLLDDRLPDHESFLAVLTPCPASFPVPSETFDQIVSIYSKL
jgi:hypothetical protein